MRLRSLARRLGRIAALGQFPWLFGGDVFVSYARLDGGEAALALAAALRARRTTVYVDQIAAPPTPTLPSSLLRSLGSSRIQVVLVTKHLLHSEAALEEIRRFSETGRTVIVTSFVGDEWRVHDKLRELIGGANNRIYASLKAWTPDEPLLDLIGNAVGYWTQRRRIHWTASLALLLLVISAAVSASLANSIQKARRELVALEGAANAQQQMAEDPRGALAAAVEAFESSDLPGSRTALLSTLLNDPRLLTYVDAPPKIGHEKLDMPLFQGGPPAALLAVADKRLFSWRLPLGGPPETRSFTQEISALAVSSRQVALAYQELAGDSSLVLIPHDRSLPTTTWRVSPGYISHLVFADDDQLVGLAPMDGLVIFHLSSAVEEWVERWSGLSTGKLATMRGADVIALTGDKGAILYLRHGSRWERRPVLEGPVIQALAFTPNGSRLLAARLDGSIVEWNQQPSSERPLRIGASIVTAVFSRDATRVAWQESDGIHVRFEVSNPSELHIPISTRLVGDLELAFSDDGNLLAMLRADDIVLWNLAKGPLGTGELRSLPSDSAALAVDPSSGALAALRIGDVSQLWTVCKGTVRKVDLTVPIDGPFVGLSISPEKPPRSEDDCNNVGFWQLAYLSDDRLALTRIEEHAVESNFIEGVVGDGARFALSPDGRHLAYCSQGFHLLDLPNTKESASRLPLGCEENSPFAFSRDSRLLAGVVGSLLDQIDIWDLRRSKLVGHIQEGEADQIWSIAFSPDGGTLAVGLMAGRVHFWDLSESRPSGVLIPRRLHPLNSLWLQDQRTAVTSLVFDLQGHRLLAANYSAVYALPGSPAAWLAVAKRRLGSASKR